MYALFTVYSGDLGYENWIEKCGGKFILVAHQAPGMWVLVMKGPKKAIDTFAANLDYDPLATWE